MFLTVKRISTFSMFTVISGIPWQELLSPVNAFISIVGGIIAVLGWVHHQRWKGVPSAREQEDYLRSRLRNASYAEEALSGTITDVHVDEDSGVLYRIRKAWNAEVTGATEITMRFDRAVISEKRLEHKPFPTIFDDPSEIGLADAEYQWTKTNEKHRWTLVRIRIHSMEYDEVGSWCSGLPTLIWDALKIDRELSK